MIRRALTIVFALSVILALPLSTSAAPSSAPPAPPTTLTASPASGNSIDLRWADASDETAFYIERSPNGSSNWQQVGSVAANTTRYQDRGLACTTTYYYRIRAYRSTDNAYSPYSPTASASTVSCDWLVNPSFEDNDDSNRRIPDGWNASWNSGNPWQDCTVAFSGACSLKFAPVKQWPNLVSQSVRLSGDANDKISLYFKVKGSNIATSRYLRIKLWLKSADSTIVITRLQNLPRGTYDWRLIVLELTTTTRFDYIDVIIESESMTGTLWIDDMSLSHISK